MGFIINILVSALAVLAAAYLIPGVSVDNFGTAILVTLVLTLVNTLVKPVLVLLTLPVTVLTLGLFLIVINILMVFLTDAMIAGFVVNGWLSALLFSIFVAVISSLFGSITNQRLTTNH